jgi:hypothetical protein
MYLHTHRGGLTPWSRRRAIRFRAGNGLRLIVALQTQSNSIFKKRPSGEKSRKIKVDFFQPNLVIYL